AQNLTFIYELRQKSDANKDSMVSGKYYLDVLGKQSVFRSEQARRSDSLKEKTGFGGLQSVLFSDQIYIQKNLASHNIIKCITTPLINNNYFIRITDKLIWKILPDKNENGEYETQKATTRYGGRNWTAWFTSSIPIQEGPYIFHGLPGFIVKISDDRSEYDFTLVRTKTSDKNSLFYLRKGKEITWEEYKKLQLDYYSDPYASIKSSGLKSQVADANGNKIELDTRTISTKIQERIRENNNSI
ncbi:GLPGLI family protein, partial [Chryseobacterium gossypii]|uniref:GLPGLI family protein n=1 Tax=Chryseobacterium gossypii TaxID=3231602 RepID=UPI003525B157